MKIIYVCSPYRGDIKNNKDLARLYSKFVITKGHIPFAPHLLLPQYLNDDSEKDRELAFKMNIEFLKRSNELWVFGGHITDGMQIEIDAAKKHGIIIRRFNKYCEEV